jgi:hypothetical protein
MKNLLVNLFTKIHKLPKEENPYASQGDLYIEETCPECGSEVTVNPLTESVECTQCNWSEDL